MSAEKVVQLRRVDIECPVLDESRYNVGPGVVLYDEAGGVVWRRGTAGGAPAEEALSPPPSQEAHAPVR